MRKECSFRKTNLNAIIFFSLTMVFVISLRTFGESFPLDLGYIKLPKYPGAAESLSIKTVTNGEIANFSAIGGMNCSEKDVANFYKKFLEKHGWRGEWLNPTGAFMLEVIDFLRELGMCSLEPNDIYRSKEALEFFEQLEPWKFYKGDKEIEMLAFKVMDIDNNYLETIVCFCLTPYGKEELPVNGDAPGCDPINIPRYPGSIRNISMLLENGECQIYVYETTSDIYKIRSFYEGAMAKHGWEYLKPLSAFEESLNSIMIFYGKSEGTLIMIYEDTRSEDNINNIMIMLSTDIRAKRSLSGVSGL